MILGIKYNWENLFDVKNENKVEAQGANYV